MVLTEKWKKSVTKPDIFFGQNYFHQIHTNVTVKQLAVYREILYTSPEHSVLPVIKIIFC